MVKKNKIIIIGGPTASGKSKLAMKLAGKSDSVIINADSLQIYRDIPILTAQPTQEDKEKIPHFLYEILPPAELCSVGKWLEMAIPVINNALEHEVTPIVVGGTGLYLKCLKQGIATIPEIAAEIRNKARELLMEVGNQSFHLMLNKRDPEMGSRLKPEDSQRILRAWEVLEQTDISLSKWQQMEDKGFFEPDQFEGYFVNPPRDLLYDRINKRFIQMVERGALKEVRKLNEMKLSPELTAMKAIGIKELTSYINGEISLDKAIQKSQQATRNYAKRQVTWFRNQMKDLKEIGDSDQLQ